MIWLVEYRSKRGRIPQGGRQWYPAGPWWLTKAEALTHMDKQRLSSDPGWEWRVAFYKRGSVNGNEP